MAMGWDQEWVSPFGSWSHREPLAGARLTEVTWPRLEMMPEGDKKGESGWPLSVIHCSPSCASHWPCQGARSPQRSSPHDAEASRRQGVELSANGSRFHTAIAVRLPDKMQGSQLNLNLR